MHLGILYEWRASWQRQNPDACFELPATAECPIVLSACEPQQLFPIVLHFSTLGLANEIALYNAILILLLRLSTQVIGSSFDPLLPVVNQPTISDGPLLLPGTTGNPQAVAVEICRSVEYHLLGAQNSAGAFNLLFPLRMALLTFPEQSREAKWVIKVMRGIADSCGFEISRNLSGAEVAK